ncbi:putative two-component response regulator [Thermostichus vulcanus NIES-2134]|nr:putative two-component response regulator [Thermostichus vulcanus NIES-2134]
MTPTTADASPPFGLMIVEGEDVIRLGLWTGIRQQLGIEPLVFHDGHGLITYLENTPLDEEHTPWIVLCDAQLTVNDATTPWLWQWLKQHYPALRIILTVRPAALELVSLAQQAAVEGIYHRNTALSDLLAGILAIAQGEIVYTVTPPQPPLSMLFPNPWDRWRYQVLQQGLGEMDAWLQALDQYLGRATLSPLERLVCEGRHREIRAARWLVSRFLPQPSQTAPRPVVSPVRPQIEIISQLVDRCLQRMQSDLLNLTSQPLELEVLILPQRRELLYTILRQWDLLVRTLQATPPSIEFLHQRGNPLLQDLWEQSLREFFRPYRFALGSDADLIEELLTERETVVSVYLKRIPFVAEMLAHLLVQQPLTLHQQTYRYGTAAALEILDALLDHWLLTVANGIVYPLLNRCCYSAVIQQTFFQPQYISTREIERFRNALSWHYRWQCWVKEPQNIFESRLVLLRLTERGIQELALTVPRQRELMQLEGIPYALTLALEARDALAPPVRAVVAWVGKGVVYLLTQVIGRGLGLIGRGILQGIGQSVGSGWSRAEAPKNSSKF